jgi:hypothetical protein
MYITTLSGICLHSDKPVELQNMFTTGTVCCEKYLVCWWVLSLTGKGTSYSDQTPTFASHSKKIQNVVHPTRSLQQQRPFNCFFFCQVGLRTYQHPCKGPSSQIMLSNQTSNTTLYKFNSIRTNGPTKIKWRNEKNWSPSMKTLS